MLRMVCNLYMRDFWDGNERGRAVLAPKSDFRQHGRCSKMFLQYHVVGFLPRIQILSAGLPTRRDITTFAMQADAWTATPKMNAVGWPNLVSVITESRRLQRLATASASGSLTFCDVACSTDLSKSCQTQGKPPLFDRSTWLTLNLLPKTLRIRRMTWM